MARDPTRKKPTDRGASSAVDSGRTSERERGRQRNMARERGRQQSPERELPAQLDGEWERARQQGGKGTRPPQREQTREERLQEIRELAHLLDNSFRIPLIGYRFGVDAVLGLVPVIGDVSAFALSSYIIWRARRMGAPPALIARMTANALGDTLVGSIPVVGTLVDVVWKANARNLKLLERFLAERE